MVDTAAVLESGLCDFVTAMLAFFLVCGSTASEQRRETIRPQYFEHPFDAMSRSRSCQRHFWRLRWCQCIGEMDGTPA